MELKDAVFLGLVQGLTEFLPVSSSGHLALAKHILGVKIKNPLAFDVIIHAGTTLSVIFVLWKDIISRLRSKENLVGVSVAFLSTVPVALLAEGFAERVEENLLLLSLSFFVGGMILIFFPRRIFDFGFFKYIFIGIMQGISAVPGISRSGTTISAAIFSGMTPPDAFGFSFFLSIPTIGSAIMYEVYEILKSGYFDVGIFQIIVGLFFSFVSGCFSILILRRILLMGKLWVFGLYMLFVSLLSLVMNFVAG